MTAILATVVLLVCGESEGIAGHEEALSSRLMRRFGFGGGRVTLVVKEQGKGIFEAHGVSVEARPGTLALRDARILSRLGKEYFVETQGQRLAIPRDLVLSWSAAVGGAGSQ